MIFSSNNVVMAAAPTITSISPLVGKIGDTVTINGNNFIGIDKILFGSIDVGLNFKAVSPTQITAVVPDGAVNGAITVVTQNFGNIVSADIFKVNLPTSNLQLSARNITQNSVTLSAYGIINQNIYYFYVYDSATYYNKKPLVGSDAIATKTLDLIDPVNPIEMTIDGLKPGLKYVGTIDYNSNSDPNTVYPFVEFSTLQDLTAGLESLTASNITGTSANIIASGLSTTNTYSVILVNDKTTPNPAYSQTKSLTPVNGTATVSFSGLTASNTYNAGLIINNNTSSVSARISFVANPNSNPNTNTSGSGTPNSTPFGGLVPKCGQVVTTTDSVTGKETSTMPTPCDFNFFMQLINNIIRFLLFTIATPLIALIIVYTGYLYITASGNKGVSEKVRHILFNAVIGYIIALAAWLIVNTIISSLKLDTNIETFMDKSTLVK